MYQEYFIILAIYTYSKGNQLAEWLFIAYIFCIREKPENQKSGSMLLSTFDANTQHNQMVI